MSYSLLDMKFRRKFSVNHNKDLKFPLGQLSCHMDWTDSKRGDPYPLLSKSGEAAEKVSEGSYFAANSGKDKAVIRRLLGQHFPFATYRIKPENISGAAGFSFLCQAEEGNDYTAETVPSVDIFLESGESALILYCVIKEGKKEADRISQKVEFTLSSKPALVITARKWTFDVYLEAEGHMQFVRSFPIEQFAQIHKYCNFTTCLAALLVELPIGGKAEIKDVSWYLDCGVAQADIRPIRYEDGMPMIENGRVYLTISSRNAEDAYQTILSWNPSGCDFKLEGALFFDAGDGYWCNDVASSILYDRNTKKYLIWVCSFHHDHVLGHGTAKGDIRYGINVIDLQLLEQREAPTSTEFCGIRGDEDPDFYYDAKQGKWFMVICRLVDDGEGVHYNYFKYVSDSPFEGYEFLERTYGGADTGGSFIKIGEKRYFVCGSDFDKRAMYKIYDSEDFSKYELVKFDYDDGGFRGWGTIIPVPCGNREKYVMITFDRMLGSHWNWSYGNIYVYEADKYNGL